MVENINRFVDADTVSALHLFPIKSCHEATAYGEPITELEVGPTGFRVGPAIDRGWVIADEDDLFVSQRGWDESQSRKHRDDRMLATVAVDIQHDHLAVSAPEHGAVVIPFEEPEGRKGSIRIFGPELPVTEEGEEVNTFFTDLLGRLVRVTRADLMRPRFLPDKYTRQGAANRSAGADGRPISLASQASLDYIHDLADIPHGILPLTSFRANIDIEGEVFGPFGEDKLRYVRVGEMGAHVVKALSRCPIPNIDQNTGDDSQRLSTKLLRPRMGWALGDDTAQRPEQFFAQSLNHRYIPGFRHIVKIGDPVIAEATGESNVVLKSS
ncbi:MAG TPA: MOSC N-terminal beta barrel domain-containing protein [Candidatus Saccharimonadales bacterium]|nr:MOSC N-terminal beta barrel domain-containing protein [Candidatus Saccharimonadales bacterium]